MKHEWVGEVQRERWDLFDGIRVGEDIILDWYSDGEHSELVGKKVRVTLEVIDE